MYLNSDPEFVSSAFIQEDEKNNLTGEDDKIYFFFTEVAKEYDLYTKVKVPRVARVCKVRNYIKCVFLSLYAFYGFARDVSEEERFTAVLLSVDVM